MFGFLGFILIFILFIVLIAVALLGNLVRAVFGLGRRAPKQYNHTRQASDYSTGSTEETTTSTPLNKKKIFGDDEGEYVEFEEVE